LNCFLWVLNIFLNRLQKYSSLETALWLQWYFLQHIVLSNSHYANFMTSWFLSSWTEKDNYFTRNPFFVNSLITSIPSFFGMLMSRIRISFCCVLLLQKVSPLRRSQYLKIGTVLAKYAYHLLVFDDHRKVNSYFSIMVLYVWSNLKKKRINI
jgi:hypothetical protein